MSLWAAQPRRGAAEDEKPQGGVAIAGLWSPRTCGARASRTRSRPACSSCTHTDAPAPPRCSWSICPDSCHLEDIEGPLYYRVHIMALSGGRRLNLNMSCHVTCISVYVLGFKASVSDVHHGDQYGWQESSPNAVSVSVLSASVHLTPYVLDLSPFNKNTTKYIPGQIGLFSGWYSFNLTII